MRRIAFLFLLALLVVPQAMAQEFWVNDLQGRRHRVSDYRGKWILVNFWATWCGPCREETPELIALHEAHKNTDLVVLGVALESPRREVERFVAEFKVPYTVGLGSYTMAEVLGEVSAFPTSFLIDPQGKTIGYQEGKVTRQEIENYIERSKRLKK